jgi:uncharacterized protein (TIGR03792 family)
MKTLLIFFVFIVSLQARRIVEELTFIVEPAHVEKFIEEDQKVWTAPLSTRAVFLRKEVIQSQKMPSEIKLLIHWRSSDDWTAVPKKLIEETNIRFEKAMGGKDRYKLQAVRAYRFHHEDVALVADQNPTLELSSLDLTPFRKSSILIPHDTVYRKKKNYRAIPLKTVVETWLENLETPVATESHEIVFECGDGYSPTRPLSEALETHGYIAFADTNAPDGQSWTPKKKFSGQDLVMAPFYLVWND